MQNPLLHEPVWTVGDGEFAGQNSVEVLPLINGLRSNQGTGLLSITLTSIDEIQSIVSKDARYVGNCQRPSFNLANGQSDAQRQGRFNQDRTTIDRHIAGAADDMAVSGGRDNLAPPGDGAAVASNKYSSGMLGNTGAILIGSAPATGLPTIWSISSRA